MRGAFASLALAAAVLVGCREERPAVAPSAPAVAWQRTFGGPMDDEAHDVLLADGDLVMAGWTMVGPDSLPQAWITRLDTAGQVRWSRQIGGDTRKGAKALARTPDGGFALFGFTDRGGVPDAWLARLDSRGATLWERTFGGAAFDVGEAIVALSDGGFALAGGTRSQGKGRMDLWIIRTDADGRLLWEKTIGGEGFDRASALVETPGGGIAVLGQTNSVGKGGVDFQLVVFDGDGTVRSDRTYGGADHDWGEDLAALPDGGFILAGETQRDSLWNAYAVRIDSTGAVVWEKTFGGAQDDWVNAVRATGDGGFVLCGMTKSKGAGAEDAWVVRLGADGTMLWDLPIGGPGYDNVHAVLPVAGGFVLAGRTYSTGAGGEDAWAMKVRVP